MRLVTEREIHTGKFKDADEALDAICDVTIELGKMVRAGADKDTLADQAAVVGALAVRMIEDLFMDGGQGDEDTSAGGVCGSTVESGDGVPG